ncbi:MAG: acyl-CoA/acyl-ACP dehydrogenase [Actinobacteria bacterium]|nr:acyl-CoA/acyl-ACP dehydrogenase [Actinomycetota bacterium]
MIGVPWAKESKQYAVLRSNALNFASAELAPVADDLENTVDSPLLWKAVEKAGEMGMLAALVPEQLGGEGVDLYSLCVALEESAVECAGFAAALLFHNAALVPLVYVDRKDLVEEFTKGRPLCTVATAGEVSLDDGKLNGNAPFVFNVLEGTVALLFPGSGEGRKAAYMRTGAEGVETRVDPYPLGWRVSNFATLEMRSAEPVFVLDKSEKEAVTATERTLYLGLAAIANGIVRKAFQKAYDYARQRYQAGKLIIEHQAMRLMLARMLCSMEEGQAIIRRACGVEDLGPAIIAWRRAGANACQAAMDGVQIHGGYGYMRDYGMERLMRDAKYCQMFPRPEEEQLLRLLDMVEQGT